MSKDSDKKESKKPQDPWMGDPNLRTVWVEKADTNVTPEQRAALERLKKNQIRKD